jgi:outer membrane protein assembly factor BamB
MADIQGQPVLDNGKIYAASHSGFLAALDLRSGRHVWESDAGSVQTPWLAGKTLFVLTTENQLVALSAEDGKTIWAQNLPRYVDPENRTEVILWTGPVLASGKLWLGSSQGELRSFNPEDGDELDTLTGFSPIYLPPVIANRTLYVLDDSGKLMALK